MKNGISKDHKILKLISNDWKIEKLTDAKLENREELEELKTIWISFYGDKCVNQSKKYSMYCVKDLISKFPLHCLPF